MNSWLRPIGKFVLPWTKRLRGITSDDDRDELTLAMDTPTEFQRIARRIGVEFEMPLIDWSWPARSLADEVLRGTPPKAIEWLANWVFKHYALGLERRAAARPCPPTDDQFRHPPGAAGSIGLHLQGPTA